MNEKKFSQPSQTEKSESGPSPSREEIFKQRVELEEALMEFTHETTKLAEGRKKLEPEKEAEVFGALRSKDSLLHQGMAYPETTQAVYLILHKLANTWNGEEFYKNGIVRYALDKIEELSPRLEEALQKAGGRGLSEAEVVHLYRELISKGDLEQMVTGAEYLAQHMDWINEQVFESEGWTRKEYIKDLVKIAAYLKNDLREQALEYLTFFVGTTLPLKDRITVAMNLLETKDRGLQTHAYEMFYYILEGYHLPAEEIWDAWVMSGTTTYSLEKNFERIEMLEEKIPGICQFLYKEYGIANFVRYPVELLTRQYEEREITEKPYGVIIYPRYDYNSAFMDVKVFQELLDQLKGEFLLRVAECESKQDIARTFLKFDKKYNIPNGQRISLLILGGHGQERSIRFGGDGERHRLIITDLTGKGVQKTGGFFSENPTIILASCSTGAEGGIGQQLSSVFKANVIAPKVPTNIVGYDVAKGPEGKFAFKARYRDKGVESQYIQGEMRND